VTATIDGERREITKRERVDKSAAADPRDQLPDRSARPDRLIGKFQYFW
jgi:hypothetical protein